MLISFLCEVNSQIKPKKKKITLKSKVDFKKLFLKIFFNIFLNRFFRNLFYVLVFPVVTANLFLSLLKII